MNPSHHHSPGHIHLRWLVAILAALSLVAAACSSSGDGETQAPDAGSTSQAESNESTVGAHVDDDDADQSEGTGSDEGADAPADETNVPLELGRGVTADTITVGFLYLDLDAVRERGLIDLNWGPQDEHVQTIVDHINANGGIGGRSIEVIARPLDPVDPESAQSACLELTEDNEVFAVLGTVRRDEVLCYTEQHETIAIVNANMTQERLDRATAPYVSVNVTRERATQGFVADSVVQGLFDNTAVAVVSVDAVAAATDVAIPALTDAGVTVELEVLIQGDGSLGGAASELSANVESMRARGIDTVFVVGDAVIAVNTFIGEGYFPTMFFTDQGAAATTAGRADMSVFPAVYTYGGPTVGTVEGFEEAEFQQECVAPWDAANPDRIVENPTLVPAGDPSHAVGLRIACRALTVFGIIAEAAGPNLNNETFGAALEEVGEFNLPGSGLSTLGDGKYDALDDLRLWILDPDAAEDEPNFTEFEG